jgi:transcriptional regulator with XRE-family HTH domain
MNISERLKQLRENKGITQEKISSDLNINRATYAHYETGRRQPDLDTVKLLAEYHNCSIDYLLGKTDIRNPYDEFLSQAKGQYGYRGKNRLKNC